MRGMEAGQNACWQTDMAGNQVIPKEGPRSSCTECRCQPTATSGWLSNLCVAGSVASQRPVSSELQIKPTRLICSGHSRL